MPQGAVARSVEFEAFYERRDAETFVATGATASPWDARMQHGGPPTALIAHAIAAAHPRDDVRIARVASEFLGAIPIGTMRVRTRVARPGRRIEMIEATIEIDGRDAVTARVWRIAVQPLGTVPPGATPPEPVPAVPDDKPVPRWLDFGYANAVEWRFVHGGYAPGPAAAWGRPRIPLVAGEETAPVERALLLADSANGISGELRMGEWLFVPPSLSIAFERYPATEWVLLDARTTMASDGLGVTTLRLADERGWIGYGTQALFIEKMAQRG